MSKTPGLAQDSYAAEYENSSTQIEPVMSPIPTTEEDLRTIGKNLQSFLASQSPEQLRSTFSALSRIASFPNITPGHRIAAFNALCGFVGQCLGSPDSNVKEIAYDAKLCSSLLHLYLQRYEYSRAKSMKQLLGCVTKAIARQPDGSGLYSKTASLRTLLNIVCDDNDEVRAKPAFHVLTSLVQKRLVSAGELLIHFETESRSSDGIEQQTRQPAEILLIKLFSWVSRQDVAPIVGSLIPVFIQSLQEQSSCPKSHSIWVRPLAQYLRTAPQALLSFRLYVLPGLCGLQRLDYWHFLRHVGLHAQFGLSETQDLDDNWMASNSNDTEVLFTALQVGKELGFVELCDSVQCQSISYDESAILICDKLLGDSLGDLDLGVRLSGMSLLISSKQQSRPLTEGTLESLKMYIPYSLMEPDANFRSEILSFTRTLVERVKAVCSLLSRTVAQHEKHDRFDDSTTAKMDMERHKDFLNWLVRLVTLEMHPNASYQRHVTALKILSILLRCGIDDSVDENELSKQAISDLRWGFSIPIVGRTLQRLLLDALMDPFEDVRQLSATILKLTNNTPVVLREQELKSKETSTTISNVFQLARSRAQRVMLQSGRIDHADGFARFSDVCFDLSLPSLKRNGKNAPSKTWAQDFDISNMVALLQENVTQIFDAIKLAKESLSAAVDQYPVHGLLTSMRYMLENATENPLVVQMIQQAYPTLGTDLEALVHDIWSCVKDALCNDAPEGFLPEDADEDVSMTTRDLLSYSWRALKEASLLLRSIVLCLESLCSSVQDQERMLESLGWLCFRQLAELRHRGAFSTVAQSFATVCLQCQAHPTTSTRSLNSTWYAATFELIQAQGSNITRRSAGIPAAIVGLLGAGIDFAQAINDLEQVASKDPRSIGSGQIDLPQVHALNCLRSAFTSSKVATASEPYLVKVTAIAARALKSELWPIRNCGLMLLRSLIDRLLGTNEAYDEVFGTVSGSKLAYDRYPGLLELLKQLLTHSVKQDSLRGDIVPESLFPALDLLRRAPPPYETRAAFLPLILDAAGNSQWHIREAAAQAFAAVASRSQLQDLDLDETLKTGSDNLAHGRLLCLKYTIQVALQRVGNDDKEYLMFLQDTTRFARTTSACWGFRQSWTPVIVKTFLDSVNILSTNVLKAAFRAPIKDSVILEAGSDLQFTISNTRAALPAIRSRLAGNSSMRAGIALACITNLLGNHVASRSSQDSGNVECAIQAELLQQDTEGFDHICQRILSISTEAGAQFQGFQPFADALAAFLSQDLLGSLATARRVFLEASTNSWRIHNIARSTVVSLLRQYSNDPSHLTEPLRRGLVSLSFSIDCWKSPSPSSTQSLLELWGASIDAKYLNDNAWTQKVLTESLVWIQYISSALADSNEFPLRYAAVLSLDGIKTASESLSNMPDILAVSIISATYTSLNDDDEEIRHIAARVAMRLLQSTPDVHQSRELSAAASSVRLCDLLVMKYSHVSHVCHEAVERMTGQRFSFSTMTVAGDVSAGDFRLQESLKEDNTLFVVEKQNLYIDPVRESEVWSGVLRRMSSSAVSKSVVEELSQWTLSGLQALISFAQTNNDGPLGWTSKPEVFGLGIQLLVTTDVLLDWNISNVQEVRHANRLFDVLTALLEIADKASLHEVWIQKLDVSVREHSRHKHQ